MTQFIYLITEGVLDVVFLTQTLRKGFSFEVVERKSELPQHAANWLSQFKWPVGDDIRRLAVPAPVFLRSNETIVGLRNAKGLEGIKATMVADQEAFLRLSWEPNATGILFDADSKSPFKRFAEFAELLAGQGHPRPPQLDAIARSGEKRAGIFAFPGNGDAGTLEDVLLPLASARFPELSRHADGYVAEWVAVDSPQPGADFKELRKPSGSKKAQLSAMVALLKPAKGLVASIEDQHWLPDTMSHRSELKPLLEFLTQLLDSSERNPDTRLESSNARPT